VIWVKDRTGRFPERPHFEPKEIEAECERLVRAFWLEQHGRTFEPPWSTEDLVTLLEQHSRSVDLYAPLASREGPDVEGMTTFRKGQMPHVEIESSLASDPRRENRLRTTLTHECTHAVLHRAVWELLWARSGSPVLLDRHSHSHAGQCRRSTMLRASVNDWMEWQAGYGSGAILIPRSALIDRVSRLRLELGFSGRFTTGTFEADVLVLAVQETFHVSADAAEVRLSVCGILGSEAGAAQTELL